MVKRIVIVNELHPNEKRIGCVRMRELADAFNRLGCATLLLTMDHSTQSTAIPAAKVNAIIQQHLFTSRLDIACINKTSFLQRFIQSKKTPAIFRKMAIMLGYTIFHGIMRSWSLSAKPYLKPIATAFQPDIVMGTFGNTNTLLIAQRLAKLANCPWILDIKDPWNYFIPTPFKRYVARRFQDACLIITLADFYWNDVSRWFGSLPHQTIYSGFPLSLLHHQKNCDSDAPFRLFIIGSCYDAAMLERMMQGITLFLDTLSKPCEIHYAGPGDAEIEPYFNIFKKKVACINHGLIAQSIFFSLAQQAAVLMYIHSDETFHHKSTELLAFKKPIICVPREHAEAIQLASEAKIPLHICQNAEDVMNALQNCFTHPIDLHHINDEAISKLSWDAQASRLCCVLKH